jgi:hypothetical protein
MLKKTQVVLQGIMPWVFYSPLAASRSQPWDEREAESRTKRTLSWLLNRQRRSP